MIDSIWENGLMDNTLFDDESIDRFFQANEDLMRLGSAFKSNIDAAVGSFKQQFSTVLKSHFVDEAVSEMLDSSFSELEKQVISNLQGLGDICTKGGRLYAFYFGTAVGRRVTAPPDTGVVERTVPKARSAPGI
jgi:hypothetical protein